MPASPLISLKSGLLVCGALLALCLLGWRTAAILAPEPAAIDRASASQAELRASDVLQTLLGHGQVIARQAIRPDGSRAWLILIDSKATGATLPDEALIDLFGSIVFIDTLDGDSVAVRRLAFAASRPSVLSPAQSAELAGLGLLAIVLLIRLGLDHLAVPANMAAPARARSDAVAPAPARRADPKVRLAARRISEDPARAAAVIRSWLRHEAADA